MKSASCLRNLCLVSLVLLASCAVEPDMRGVEVVRYTGPPITLGTGYDVTASVTDGATVTIDWENLYNREYKPYARLVLRKSYGELPAFADAQLWPGRPDYPQSIMRTGTIHIEHFDLEGVVSGYMRGAFYTDDFKQPDHAPLYFWVDLSAQASAEENAAGVR